MISPSTIHPDVELKELLAGTIEVGLPGGGTKKVTVYGDWERPTNGLPDDFIVIYLNGDVEGMGKGVDFARGNLMVGLYCKLNDDGSVKKNRVDKILVQFDHLFVSALTENYHFEYDTPRFITPTTPNMTSGYSITNLNLRWHTNNNFNQS